MLALLVALHGIPVEPGVLLFGGGWGPEGNQASIERDVTRLARVLGPRARLLFGAGDTVRRTVQTSSPTDPVSWRLGLVFGRLDGLGVGYRPAQVSPQGPATPETVTAAIVALSGLRGGGVVFGAGHGSPAAGEDPAALELWGGAIDPATLADALEAAPARGPLTLVLGQCHSGAFADLAHRGADPERPLAEPTRCVLAAVPRDLAAAGCSPDADDPESQAFLFTIVSALVDPIADYDGDGRVRLDEAFAHARLHDDTVDVPVRSSELWLDRQVSEVSFDGVSRGDALRNADPSERAVLLGLADGSPSSVRRRLDDLLSKARELDERVSELEAEKEEARGRALNQLLSAFPELANPYHPRSRSLLSGAAPAVVGLWAAEPKSIRALEAADIALRSAASERWGLEKTIARVDRWVRTARSVLARGQLPRSKRRELERLRACEARLVPGLPPG